MVCVCVRVCVVRPPVSELLSTGLLPDAVLCDDVITDVWPRDPVSGRVRYGSVAFYNCNLLSISSRST